jgi:hypothetical protein
MALQNTCFLEINTKTTLSGKSDITIMNTRFSFSVLSGAERERKRGEGLGGS